MAVSLKSNQIIGDTERLPTHLARVAGRVNLAGPDASGDTFLMTSYVVEALLKTIAVCLASAIRRSSPTVAYKLEYDLIRADGLGTWEAVIGACTTESIVGYINADLNALVTWLSQRRGRSEDSWARESAADCGQILTLLGVADTSPPAKLTVRHILGQLVRIRNMTKAHGAVGPDFFAQANPLYVAAVRRLIENCPAGTWEWFFLAERPSKGTVKAVALRGPAPAHVPGALSESLRPRDAGIHFRTHERGQLFHCGDLIRTTWECNSFRLPNGGLTNRGEAEFLDYADGSREMVDVARYLTPPAPPPPSTTEGASSLDICSNVFGNLPRLPDGYVQRPTLQGELLSRLIDRNHPIITLHGR